MTAQTISAGPAASARPGTAAAFRPVTFLLAGYLAISVAALAVIAVTGHHSSSSVRTHGIIVAATALVAFALAIAAARGSRGAWRRLRIISVVNVAGIAVTIALPDSFPAWMKAEQGAAGLLMTAVAVLVNSSRIRSLFTAR